MTYVLVPSPLRVASESESRLAQDDASGNPADDVRQTPRWATWGLIALLMFTGVLYCYRLDVSGYANAYYAAAAQSGSSSWKAFFFGSLDGGNIITVDKPPAALWFMALSVRIFGLSSWSILLPQAAMGVASVALLYFTVRRWHGPAAGLLAAGALASTPVATLMFRFDNPDALLTLLVVAAAYATVRAVETADPRWAYVIGR
ncbi:MAG: glycosyltransferase family 39 protein [Antricoccus sp.]